MENSIKIAAQAYASLNKDYSNYKQVLEAIQSGNKVVEQSVINLMILGD